ncbi:MAG: TerB family tellurite resistance protein [Pseudomonadales bacterium]
MLDNIKKFFDEKLLPKEDTDPAARTREIQYATAALLIELARSDFDEDPMERALIVAMLRDTFDLGDDVIDELMEVAGAATDDAHDIYQFTQLVNEHYQYADKIQLVENLWEVAYADGRLDRYEEQFIRKVSGLLHVPTADFIKAKIEVLARIEARG